MQVYSVECKIHNDIRNAFENSVKLFKDKVICSYVKIINQNFVKYIMIYTLFWLSWEKDGIKLKKDEKEICLEFIVVHI